ncbi:eosinophil cationic protein-like [Apodemus sylvaticus]|uniref:eosinophil cationic protein-like n=1 Tax=Apodemus sylvaticus TaxID=10129 RepID=UPI0022437A49|nr:eosinophil cationic protein-like [Apodemus sylvaticus]
MGLKLLKSRICVLLQQGFVLTLASCQQPTPSQKFEIQHIYKSAYPQCDDAMRVVNKLKRNCKQLNTFLHTTFADVLVCGNPNTNCSDRIRTNCHNSSSRVSITVCNLTTPASHYTQCRYQTTESVKYYTVACDRRTPRDSPIYPVVPVHLDKTF